MGDSWPLGRGKVGLRGKLRAVPHGHDAHHVVSFVDLVEEAVWLDDKLPHGQGRKLGNVVTAARESAKLPQSRM